MNSYFLVSISAVLYALAFLSSRYLWWFSFLYLVPLFYAVEIKKDLSFKEGYVWGLIAYGIQLFSVCALLHYKADGFLREIGYLLLIGYFALYSGVWFWSARVLGNNTLSWWLITFLHWYALTYYSFFVVSRVEGYPFAISLLPLSEQPFLIYSLTWFGINILMFCLIGGVLCLVHAYVDKKNRTYWTVGFILSAIPFLIGWIYVPEQKILVDVTKIGYITPLSDDRYNVDTVHALIEQIDTLTVENPQINIVLAPESTCRFVLNEKKQLMENLALCNKKTTLVLGAHRIEHDNLYNSLYILEESLIRFPYDKKHQFPFVEYLPLPWNNISFFKNLFLSKHREFNSSSNQTTPIIKIEQFSFIPMICSDLFFGNTRPIQEVPIVVLVNDHWFSKTPYFQHVLWLMARFKAIEWQRPIFYIAHTGGWFFDEFGNDQVLNKVNTND